MCVTGHGPLCPKPKMPIQFLLSRLCWSLPMLLSLFSYLSSLHALSMRRTQALFVYAKRRCWLNFPGEQYLLENADVVKIKTNSCDKVNLGRNRQKITMFYFRHITVLCLDSIISMTIIYLGEVNSAKHSPGSRVCPTSLDPNALSFPGSQ